MENIKTIWNWGSQENKSKVPRLIKEYVEKSYLHLNQQYGAYFRGSRNQVTKRIVDYLNS